MNRTPYLVIAILFTVGAFRRTAEAALVFGALACASMFQTVHASVVYSQVGPSAPLGAFSSNDTPDGQKIADNFVLDTGGSSTVRSVRFVGGYGVRNPPPQTPPLDELPTD